MVRDREPIGLALRRFKKEMQRQGLSWEMRRRKHFLDANQLRRAKQFKKRLKARAATLEKQMTGEQPVASLPEAKAVFRERRGKA